MGDWELVPVAGKIASELGLDIDHDLAAVAQHFVNKYGKGMLTNVIAKEFLPGKCHRFCASSHNCHYARSLHLVERASQQ